MNTMVLFGEECQPSLFILMVMDVLLMHHEMLEIFQKCCYGDKYLAERMLHSNNDVTQSGAAGCENALLYLHCILSSFSKTYFTFIIETFVFIKQEFEGQGLCSS